jgi:hypothetical protein
MDEGERLAEFPELFPVRKSLIAIANSKGIAMYLANDMLRKNQPCVLCSLYYIVKEIEQQQPTVLIGMFGEPLAAEFDGFTDEAIGWYAEFDGFTIQYDEAIGWYDYVETGDTSKYGKDFGYYASLIVRVRNEDGVCRNLLTAIYGKENGKVDITDDGIEALYGISSFIVTSIRVKGTAVQIPVKEVEERVIVAPTKEIPELSAVVGLIGYIAKNYNMSVDEVIELVRKSFKRK